jgi:hypothetical protein
MLTYPAHNSGKTGMLVGTTEATAMNDGADDDRQAVVEVSAGESQRHSQTTAELKHYRALTKPLFEAG